MFFQRKKNPRIENTSNGAKICVNKSELASTELVIDASRNLAGGCQSLLLFQLGDYLYSTQPPNIGLKAGENRIYKCKFTYYKDSKSGKDKYSCYGENEPCVGHNIIFNF